MRVFWNITLEDVEFIAVQFGEADEQVNQNGWIVTENNANVQNNVVGQPGWIEIAENDDDDSDSDIPTDEMSTDTETDLSESDDDDLDSEISTDEISTDTETDLSDSDVDMNSDISSDDE